MKTSATAVLKPVGAPDSGRYQLSGRLDFVSVPLLLQQGYEWLGQADTHIDLAEVRYAGSAAIGLLLEWLRQARLRKTRIHFHNIPQTLLEIARISDVQDWFTDPQSAA